MDFSKQYILMCQKAEEIQKIAKGYSDKGVGIDNNEFYGHINGYQIDMHGYVYNSTVEGFVLRGETKAEQFGCAVDKREKIYEANEIIWLPRQDELQDIYDDNQEFIHQNIEHFYRWYKSNAILFKSMEQLWLAFVTKEKYNKVWDKEEWVLA